MDRFRWSLAAAALFRNLAEEIGLEIGRKLLRSSGSRPGFLKMGVIEAVLRQAGTIPEVIKELNILPPGRDTLRDGEGTGMRSCW